MKLKAPEGVTQFVTSGGTSYPVDENGLVETDNADHVREMTHHAHGFVPHTGPSAPVAAPEEDDEEENTDDPFAGMTKADLRDWLDERDIEYDAKASKADLLEIAQANTKE